MHGGATAGDFEKVKPIFEKNCIACRVMNIANAITYENFSDVGRGPFRIVRANPEAGRATRVEALFAYKHE